MFAEREDFDVLDDDHLVVVLVEERPAQDFGGVLVIAAGQVGHGLLYPPRRGQQALAAGILAQAAQNLAVHLLRAELAQAFLYPCRPANGLAHWNRLRHGPHPPALGNRAYCILYSDDRCIPGELSSPAS